MSFAERAGWAVAAAYLALALHGLGASDIVGDDEAREAGIVQEVVAGDWLLPRFNGETFPDKPLLYHWLAAIPCRLAGFSELGVRLPSALAGAAAVAWTARFGTRLFGAPAGLASAVALAAMPALFDRARMGRPDVLLVLLLSLALGAAWEWARTDDRGAATRALGWLGAATCAKGPVAPAVFVLAVAGFLVWERAPRRLARLLTPAGVALFAVLGLGWYAVACAGWGWPFVAAHLVGRYAGNVVGGFGSGGYVPHGRSLWSHLWFHPVALAVLALPVTPVALVGLRDAGGTPDARRAATRFLCCWAAAPVVAFMPAAIALRYYVLPALPTVALLAGPTLAAAWRRDGRWRAALAAGVAGVAVWYGGGVPQHERTVAAGDSLRPFAEAVAARYPPPAPLAFYGPPVRSVVVYARRHAPSLGWHGDAVTPGLGVIATEPAYRELAARETVGPPLLSAEGRTGNRARGRIVLAEGLRRPDAAGATSAPTPRGGGSRSN